MTGTTVTVEQALPVMRWHAGVLQQKWMVFVQSNNPPQFMMTDEFRDGPSGAGNPRHQ